MRLVVQAKHHEGRTCERGAKCVTWDGFYHTFKEEAMSGGRWNHYLLGDLPKGAHQVNHTMNVNLPGAHCVDLQWTYATSDWHD